MSLISSGRGFVKRQSWNPYDVVTYAIGGANNLQALNSGTYHAGARGVLFSTSGKFYFELLWDQVTVSDHDVAIGIADIFANVAEAGYGTSYYLVYQGYSDVRRPIETIDTLTLYYTGDTVSVAVDLDAKLVWFRLNGGVWNGSSGADPSSGIGGYSYTTTNPITPVIRGAYNGDGGTANFGNLAPFTYAPPAGFGSWQ